MFAERDSRRIMLGVADILKFFYYCGVASVRHFLTAWAVAFCFQLNPAAPDWSQAIDQNSIFVIPFANGHRKLIVEVLLMAIRDSLCQQLGSSPVKLKQWPLVTVRAHLTIP